MNFDETQIWTPKITMNDDENFYDFHIQHRISSSGRVAFDGIGVISNNCILDFTYFPYDVQYCTFTFTCMELNIDTAILVPSIPEKVHSFIENEEWDVTEMSASHVAINPTNVSRFR